MAWNALWRGQLVQLNYNINDYHADLIKKYKYFGLVLFEEFDEILNIIGLNVFIFRIFRVTEQEMCLKRYPIIRS